MAAYEVCLVTQGVEEKLETHYNEGAAYAAAERLAKEAAESLGAERESVAWHVYVTPLVAAHDDEDEVFVAAMPDHRPYRSG